jgi:ribosome-associated protein
MGHDACMADIPIRAGLAIPEGELEVSFARSGGPGGQHANTSSTKVELRFDVAGSPSLTEEQKARITSELGSRLTKDGVLVLQASEHRSQTRNREAVEGRFANLLSDALRPRRRRRATRPSRAAKRRRLERKRRQSEKKALRRNPPVP